MYRISVIIPTFNREKYIRHAVQSVLDQTGQDEGFEIAEILIVDDGSTDNTEGVVKGIPDERIIYHRMPVNGGPAVARNTGVAMANGDWIAFQDSDDIWHSDKLIKQVEYLNDNHDTDMVSHPIKAVFDDGSELITGTVESEDISRTLAEKNCFDTPTMLVRKECFIALGGFNTELKALEDWEFALRFADRYRIGMVPEVLIEAEMISGGVSSGAADYYESRCKIIALDRDILMSNGCFDNAVRSLLNHAQRNELLPQVGKMLELYLSEGMD